MIKNDEICFISEICIFLFLPYFMMSRTSRYFNHVRALKYHIHCVFWFQPVLMGSSFHAKLMHHIITQVFNILSLQLGVQFEKVACGKTADQLLMTELARNLTVVLKPRSLHL